MGLGDDQFAELCAVAESDGDSSRVRWARDSTARARTVLFAHGRRLALKARWAQFFRDHDALICPITPTTAIAHDQRLDQESTRERWITVNGARRDYWDQVIWTQAISAVHLPVAAVPVGMATDALPVGVQVVGPYLEDRTVIDLAGRIAEVVGGFVRPSSAL